MATIPTGWPWIVREPGDQRRPVERLELVEPRPVDDPGDHLAHVVGRSGGRSGTTPYSSAGSTAGSLGRARRPTAGAPRGAERPDDRPHDPQRVRVVVGEVVGDPGDARVQVAAAQLLGGHDLAGRRLHQRRAAEEDRALVADDHRLVAHRRHVRPARRARAEHGGDLRDALRGHLRLVVEDPAEVLAVGEHLVLHRQERAAGVDEVDARQAVLQRDLLRPQVLLHRHRVVGAALDRRVVGDDHALAPGDPPDPGDDPRGRGLAAVEPVRGERRQLEERRRRVEQRVDPVARQQLAPLDVPRPRPLRTTQPAVASCAFRSATSARCASALRANGASARSTALRSTGASLLAVSTCTPSQAEASGRSGRGRVSTRASGADAREPGRRSPPEATTSASITPAARGMGAGHARHGQSAPMATGPPVPSVPLDPFKRR